MTILRILLYVNLYVVGALVAYAILNHYDPYDPEKDTLGDGDCNKLLAFLWPITLVGAAIYLPINGILMAFDIIREMQKKK